jgi:hypothetical protein
MKPITNPICQLDNESKENFDLFLKFVDLGSISNVYARIQGKFSMRKLYYMAKQFNWNERRFTADYEVVSNVVEERIKDVIGIYPLQVKNTINSACALERITDVVLTCLPTDFISISERISINPVKILQYANNFNIFIKNYNFNRKTLNDKLLEIGIDIQNLTPIIQNINFGKQFDDIINDLSPEEIASFKLDIKSGISELSSINLNEEKEIREITLEKQEHIINNFKEEKPDWDAFYKELDADDLAYEKKRKKLLA